MARRRIPSRRTCPACGVVHRSVELRCPSCANAVNGYFAGTRELTIRIRLQPPAVAAEREARILAHQKRIQERINP